MRQIDFIPFVDDLMKASRSVAHWSACMRHGFVGAFLIGSLLLGIQPVHANSDVKGDADSGAVHYCCLELDGDDSNSEAVC